MRILTHIIGETFHCVVCGRDLPIPTKDGQPVQVQVGARIGVIESRATPHSAYLITSEHDSNQMCEPMMSSFTTEGAENAEVGQA
jgi:hypothetical protein